MRVVMVTDDVQIDRRILQEASTLLGRGDEVILLARGGPDDPVHERLDGTKIERLAIAGDGTRERLVRGVFNQLVRPCRAIRGKLIGGGGRGSLGWWITVPLAVLERVLRVVSSQSVRVVRRTRRLPYRDAVLADRVAYYRPDVIHAHDLPQLRPAIVAASRVGAPVVYDAHELYPEIVTLPSRVRRRLARLERALTPRSAAIITVNPYLADEIARRYGVARPHVVLNAIDASGMPNDPETDLRKALRLADSARVVLYQGWIASGRGLDLLVDALVYADPSVHVVLLGYGEHTANLLELATARHVADRVHALPAVPQSELLAWTASADLGVIPYPDVDLNHRFCSPNKLFEFIQAGVPIVANDLPYLRDVIVGEGIGIVATVDDPRAFAAAIDEALMPERRSEFARRARSIRPRYSWAAQEPTLLAVYDGLDHTRAGFRSDAV